jgi:hypothetical protein
LWNANAQVSFEKINLEADTVRIQTQAGYPVIDVQLLENTDHCFIDCYAILKIHPYQDITLPQRADSEFAWNFAKEKPWMDGLVSYHFELLETVEYEVEVPDYGTVIVNSNCYDEHNQTYQCETNQTLQTGSHQETRHIEEYKPFAFWGRTLAANTDYTVKLEGKKSVSTQENNMDWRPVIKGLELDEWAWWNTSWGKCKKITNSSQINFPSGYEINFTFYNTDIPYADFMANFADFRVTNGTDCNMDGGTSLDFWRDPTACTGNTATPCTVYIEANQANMSTFLVYYNATGASDASNGKATFDLFDDFDDSSINTTIWETSGSVTETGGYAMLEGGGSSDFLFSNTSTLSFSTNKLVHAYSRADGTYEAPHMSYSGFMDANNKDNYSFSIRDESGGEKTYWNGDDSKGNSWKTDFWSGYDHVKAWKHHVIARNGSSTAYTSMCSGEASESKTFTNTNAMDVYLRNWNSEQEDSDTKVDWIFVADYSDPSPSWSIGGVESQQNIIIHSPENKTYGTSSIELNWSSAFGNNLDWAGYSLNDGNNISLEAELVYQESADSAVCGGSWHPNNPCNLTYDSEWETSGASTYPGGWVYFNYTKPTKAIGANWTKKYVETGFCMEYLLENQTVPDVCFDQDVLQFMVDSINTGDYFGSNWSCWNGTGWQSLDSHVEYGGCGNYISEEAVWWLMEDNFVNTTITAQEGSNKLSLCANETGGTKSCETVYFTVDLTPPSISITFPQNNGQYDLTWINITGIASDANPDSIWTNDTIFGENVGTYESWNFTNTSMKRGPHSVAIYANDTVGNVNSTQVSFYIGKWNITFYIYSGETGENLTGVSVSCNNSWSGIIDSWDVVEFGPGWWSCTFEKSGYFDKTIVFYTDKDNIENVKMSEEDSLTKEEHFWLEDVYNCLINKDCDVYDLWNQTYQYASNIWDQFKQTDESVVVSEQTTSSIVNDTSNLTIEYLIDVPIKEDYKFLPIRIFYWFMDDNNETCYNQAKEGNNAEAPFCNPLVAQTIGEVNMQINFTVELRPNLPEGNYTVIRRIDIDPDNVWINYGHEAIGRLEVIGNSGSPGITLSMNGNPIKHGSQKPAAQTATQTDQQQTIDKTTGMITVQQIDSISHVAVIVSVITLILVGLMFKNSSKRNHCSH